MIEATHTLNDEFQTPDRVRIQVVETILQDGLVRIRRLAREGDVKQVETISDLLHILPLAITHSRSWDRWCDQDIVWALDEDSGDLLVLMAGWKQLVDSVREDPPY